MAAIDILVLGAGLSRRMGDQDKMLQMVNGQPVLGVMVKRAVWAARPLAAKVYATVPENDPDKAAIVRQAGGQAITVARPALGLAEGFHAYARVRTADAAVMVIPADMPAITAEDMGQLLGAWAADGALVHRGATSSGVAGHPVVLPARLAKKLGELSGDKGAASLFQNEAPVLVTLPADNAILDLDSPADWAKWRTRHAGPSSGDDSQ